MHNVLYVTQGNQHKTGIKENTEPLSTVSNISKARDMIQGKQASIKQNLEIVKLAGEI